MARSTSRSTALFEASQRVIPGGVNSPVRAFAAVGGTPVFFKRAEGAMLYDEDGNAYIDYMGSWGPMILGHAYPPVVEAVQRAAALSTSFGAPTELELLMAELVCRMVPGVDKVRMVNSGTEACLSAIRLARGYTGREKIIKFAGNYHGHGDSFLIKAGSGAVTLGLPNSPGVTAATASNTLLAEYNNLAQVQALVAEHGPDVAAIIVEPVAGNMGCVPPAAGFLQGLRELCTAQGIVLIFDEVMTGFRLAPGGAQELLGITADLVTLGKVIGAGLPVGAYGGKQEIMAQVAPEGPVYQAGTLSGNPLAMAAGLALLTELNEHPEHYSSLERKSQALAQGVAGIFTEAGVPYQQQQLGSMQSIHFSEVPVTDFASVQQQDVAAFGKLFHHLLEEGVYLPPSAFESWFLSDALTDSHLDQTLAAFRSFFRD